MVQVDGLDDLAPLAATAPPGVPDLPEGDIIALGDEVGVIMIIIIIIVIHYWYYCDDYYYYHYCSCQRCCRTSMALATLGRGPSYRCSRPRRSAQSWSAIPISTLLRPEPWWRRTGCNENSTLQQHFWPTGMRSSSAYPPFCLGRRRRLENESVGVDSLPC